jgi:anaerobic ribonucleoside-triphosphate reductase activating protein
VMVFTGYLLTKLRQSNDPDTQTLLNHTDVLVDGPYLQDQPDTTRRWIGSRNQGRHFLTNRYHVSEPCWSASNTLEIRIRDGVVLVNGFPSPATRDLWKGWHRPDRTNRTGGTE